MLIFLILLVIVIAFGLYFTYKNAEVHMLHKMRAGFENKHEDILKLIKERHDDPDFNMEYYKGELEEIDEVEAMIDKELEILKNFDFSKII